MANAYPSYPAYPPAFPSYQPITVCRYQIRKKIFSLGDNFKIKDEFGRDLVGLLKIHQELFHFHPTFNILSARDGDSDRQLARLDIFAHSFVLTKQGQVVVTISTALFSLADTYGVEIAANEDQTFILALVIVIDQVLYDENRNNH
ncbi:unnamed protein product [Rotaria sp. Silwood2]|nr:unnamed protein product [Rotaria sp. Silwood2]CAF4400201.1 unnamed protein product [Rotaria sp. Silwood2]